MKKLTKKLLSLILIGTMMFSTSAVVTAAPAEEVPAEPIYVDGIEEFFSKNADGTMSLDVDSAQAAGYTERSIEFILGNIEKMNDMVLTQGAYINDDFVATLYFSSTRAGGQSKVECWATGMVLVYMTDAEAKDLYNTITALNWIGNVFDLLSNLDEAYPILAKACAMASAVANLSIGSYSYQINQARSNGTGIIMYVAPMPDGIGSYATFGAQ